MEVIWVQLEEFPDYSINTSGEIRNDVRDRLVSVSHTRQGAAKVGLMKDSKQHTRSVKVLVAETFLEKTNPLFDTPIHLDGDQKNCNVSNLVWRPRWFAWKYHHQLEEIDLYEDSGAVIDTSTEIIYSDIVEAALTNGLLFYEVRLSVHNKIPVFPTYHMFEWV